MNRKTFMAVGTLLVLLACAARAEVLTAPSGAFSFTLSGDMKGTPEAVFAAATGVVEDEMLRYEGPLGLAGFALHMVTTWTFAPASDVGRTTVTVEVHGAGELHEGWPEVIEKTWRHFLFERLQPYLEGR